jgi:myo-inositol catabolism protein IolC
MKQTAVEWLLQRFEDGDMYNVEDAQFIKHQALAMEYEQLIDAWKDAEGYNDENAVILAKQYYNKTFKGGQDA